MKSGKRILTTLILLGLLAGTMVPASAEEEAPPTITFHVVVENLAGQPVPEDSEETIIFEGAPVLTQSNSIAAIVQNLCEGEGCTAQDIYWRIELDIDWSGDGWFPSRDQRPTPRWQIGSSIHLPAWTNVGKCGDAATWYGSCEIDMDGMIPEADMSTNPDIGHESWIIAFDAPYGGLSITTGYTITFSTQPIIVTLQDCAGQYIQGGALGTVTLAGTNYAGVNLQTSLGSRYPAAGAWYAVTVTSGAWQDDGLGADLRTMAIRVGTNGTWLAIDANPRLGCSDAASDTYYLQMTTDAGPTYLRVGDFGENWADNTGALVVTITSIASYNRYPSGCELQYKINNLIEQQSINAEWVNGWALDRREALKWNPYLEGGGADEAIPIRYLALETIGGPANLGAGGYTWDADLGPRPLVNSMVPSAWYEIQTAPFVTCVVATDLLGHVKVYFPLDQYNGNFDWDKLYYAFRVRDTGAYTDNSGTLGYRLYEAALMQVTTPGESPSATGCQQFSHDATAIETLVLYGVDNDGVALGALDPGELYAFETAGGPWTDNGSNSYAIQISDDNGHIWWDLDDYENLLCAQSEDGDHVIIYIYAAAGKTWRFRVDDSTGNFTNNALSIQVKAYDGGTSIDYWPTCKDDYTLKPVSLGTEQRKVPGNMEAGKVVPGIISGEVYSIEITGENKWYEAGIGTGSYLVEISDDGGVTWESFEKYGTLCSEMLSNGGRYILFFTATSNNYKLRVKDTDDNYLTNTGMVLFELSSATDTSTPPTTGDTGTPPPEWVVACNEAYQRPSSWITWYGIIPVPRVGEWIDYLRAAVTYYFAWCPQHTAAIESIGQTFTDKEPLASISMLMDFVKSIEDLLDGYQAAGGAEAGSGLESQEPELFSDTAYIGVEGGGANFTSPSTTGPWDLFMVGQQDPDTNIWYGGQLDMAASLGSTDLSSMDAYEALCSGKFYPLFGIGANAFCSLMAMMRFSKIVMWVLLGLDLFVSVWFLLFYFPRYLRRFWGVISGNKGTIKTIASKL